MAVIALTSDAGPTIEETARECGASGCLHKPLDPELVRSFLDQTLGVEAPLEL